MLLFPEIAPCWPLRKRPCVAYATRERAMCPDDSRAATNVQVTLAHFPVTRRVHAASHAAAHIPGCRHIASQQDVDALDDELDLADAVIVYCYHGNASKDATLFLKQKGFTNVHSMTGGFEAWRAAYAVEQ